MMPCNPVSIGLWDAKNFPDNQLASQRLEAKFWRIFSANEKGNLLYTLAGERGVMEMYTRILVPLDGSLLAEQVLPYVKLLAKRIKCHTELLQVIQDSPAPTHPRQVTANLSDEAQRYLKKAAASLKSSGLTVSSLVHHGDPASDIVAEAESKPGTLLMMTPRGSSGFASRWMLASITDKVLHVTTNPLLVVRVEELEAATIEAILENVIVPLDESPLAEQVLPHAVYLATTMGLRIILLRVTPAAEDFNRYIGYVPGNFEDFTRFIDARGMEYLHKVGQKLREQGLTLVEERLLHGHPAEAIVDLARETPHSLVAMTTHGRSGVGRWQISSVADRVVRHSASSVLVVRPVEEDSD
jgi:nucleotide-binding universal stress UspA family protein